MSFLHVVNDSQVVQTQWERLWCECGGESTGLTHHQTLSRQLDALHEGDWERGVAYVVSVLCLYVIGIILIIATSGIEFNDMYYWCHNCMSAVRPPFVRRRPLQSKPSTSRVVVEFNLAAVVDTSDFEETTVETL